MADGEAPGKMRARLRCVGSDDRGMTLVELLIALSVLGLVLLGLAGTITVSYAEVQLARSRQVAEAAANKRLEELRDIDYSQLALATAPTHSTDATSPDYFVKSGGSEYDYTGNDDDEALIVDTISPGPVPHIESPVTVGKTVVDVYQYVTWADDPGIPGTQNLKRMTVVVRYRNIALNGTAHMLRESVLFTPGNVILPAVTPDATTTTTTTTIPPTTTTTTALQCGGFTVSGGGGAQVGYTATTTVTATMSLPACGSPIYVNFSNDGTTWGPDVLYDATNPSLAWTINGGNGTRTISGRARVGSSGTPWTLPQQSIVLDTTMPSTPGTLTRTASCSGSNRTVVLSWGTATDTNLVGYRVRRSTDGVSWQIVQSTTSLTASDTASKTLTSVRYYVTAYDKAGNESSATNTITLSKNQCS